MSLETPSSSMTHDLVAKGEKYYLPVYSPQKFILSHGRGSRLWDTDGREYIDMSAGISVNSLGHQHPELVAAFKEQGEKLWHISNLYYSEPAIRLAEELVSLSFAERVFFANSGAEANEAAIKIARKYASAHFAEDKREIITFQGSFHGRTITTVSATAQPKYQKGFAPLTGGFVYCNLNDRNAVDQAISEKTCAVLIEPIQGEGGINISDLQFLEHLRQLCDQYKALLIFDEIQCGMGRTGKLFAYEWTTVIPDIMTLAKALGGGLPLGAVLTTNQFASVFSPGDHGSTFGGNPVMCAVARAALKVINSRETLKNVEKQGATLKARLQEMNKKYDMFSEIRGQGLIVGAELKGRFLNHAPEINHACHQQGVMILQAGKNVLRFLPPLNISDEELNTGLERMEQAFSTLNFQE
ncbi:MAG: aspartate aminotransferase family protein [SAR324 cluster bacterium]|nr:aspartate aminotransferase family protein [SAR324 cluster bacterium]